MKGTPVALKDHLHEIAYHPTTGNGWGVCECGATIPMMHGRPVGGWHACSLCVSAAFRQETA